VVRSARPLNSCPPNFGPTHSEEHCMQETISTVRIRSRGRLWVACFSLVLWSASANIWRTATFLSNYSAFNACSDDANEAPGSTAPPVGARREQNVADVGIVLGRHPHQATTRAVWLARLLYPDPSQQPVTGWRGHRLARSYVLRARPRPVSACQVTRVPKPVTIDPSWLSRDR